MTGTFRPPAHPVLDTAYANTAGAVAYLDETFHHGENGAARFYVFTAVVVERTEMSLLREELREIAGGTFWHTTDELRTEEGRKKASSMLQFLGEGDEVCVIAHHSRIDDSDAELEDARRACLQGVASTLSTGAAPLGGPIDLMVARRAQPQESQQPRSQEHQGDEGRRADPPLNASGVDITEIRAPVVVARRGVLCLPGDIHPE